MSKIIERIGTVAWAIMLGLGCIIIGVQEFKVIETEIKRLGSLNFKSIVVYLRNRQKGE